MSSIEKEIQENIEDAEDYDIPSLSVEEEITEGIQSSNLQSKIDEAYVSGINVEEEEYNKTTKTIYKVYFTYEGSEWSADFVKDLRRDMNHLRKLLDRHDVDITTPANLVGKKITVSVVNSVPRVVYEGPTKSEIDKQLDKPYLKQKQGGVWETVVQYRTPFRLLINWFTTGLFFAPMLLISAIYQKVGLFNGLFIISLCITLMVTIIGIMGLTINIANVDRARLHRECKKADSEVAK